MHYLFLTCALILGATSATAQKVVRDENGNRGVLVATPEGGRVIPYDEYFGADADALRGPIGITEANLPRDRMRWETKLTVAGWTENSCSKASENIITDVISENALPPGWEIRQLGTLGNLTVFENEVASGAINLYNWWEDKPYNDEFPLTDPRAHVNPPSYAHTTTAVKSPDGNYYIVDNWHGNVEVKRVYPVGDVPDNEFSEFLSNRPDAQDNLAAQYRLHLSGLGKYFDEEPGPDDQVNPREVQVSTPPPTSEQVDVEVLQSADPNDKMGLRGVGEGRFIAEVGSMDYVIRFENKADASAPAQEVLVRDTLDAQVFDFSTFELGDIQFGSRRVEVVPGLSSFSTRIPLEDTRFEVVISASLVAETGIVTWRFTTLDTDTNDLPFDPLDGFLPPNQSSPEGEGSVSFTIHAREGLPNGTEIRNQARIVFDLNEPIDTPPWSNTLDLSPPTTRVAALAEVQSGRVFPVQWGGEDADSGVRTYDVYVSVNGREFYQWLHRIPVTEEMFAGDADSTYSFFSIGYDAVGNAEPLKSSADATTGVAVASEQSSGLPGEVTLAAPFPNPAASTGALTLHFGLPTPDRVDVRVYDVRGRELAVLAGTDYAAGWHTLRWDLRGMASGVYVVRLRTGGEMRTRTVTVVR